MTGYGAVGSGAASDPVGVSAGPDLPGAHQGRARALQQLLVAELEPRDAIERLWLSDVAHMTARLEHLRMLQCGFYLQVLHSRVKRETDLLPDQFTTSERKILADMAADGFALDDDADPADLDLYNRFLSYAIEPNLNRIKLLDDLERGMLRERDRVFAQFEKRRRSQVIEAVRELEQPVPVLPSPGA